MGTWKLAYPPQVISDDISSLGAAEAKRVKNAIETKLAVDPFLFGKPLRYSLKGVRALRVGDWRILYIIDASTIRIGAIMHRSVVYAKKVEQRF